MNDRILHFKRDTSFRKRMFSDGSFAHPAKMDSQLLIWIIERYTKEGEIITDPMFGSGTSMLAALLGRHVIGIELEQKFVRMALANWESIKCWRQLEHPLGQCWCLWGDARNLLSARPHPYRRLWPKYPKVDLAGVKAIRRHAKLPLAEGVAHLTLADLVVTSPPFGAAHSGGGIAVNGYDGPKHSPTDLLARRTYMPKNHGVAAGQIGNLPYGEISAVITSPPYESTTSIQDYGFMARLAEDNPDRLRSGAAKGHYRSPEAEKRYLDRTAKGVIESPDNIGRLKSSSYLEAMLQAYRQFFAVLRVGGVMVLVTKNFIRDQKEVRLDLDTIKLAETAGFSFQERWYREMPSQSFWRTMYRQKYPDAPELKYEDVLVFKKEV